MPEVNEKNAWIGFDLGGTKMHSIVFNDALQEKGRVRKKTKGTGDSAVSLERIIKTIDEALAAAHLTGKSLAGIGVGAPGALDLEKGVVINAPNLGWKSIALQEKLEKEYGCPVALVNDVDAGVYGEYCKGAAVGVRSAVGIFPGTGIGGGCVYEGKLLRGAKTSCMEVGHLQMIADGPLCGCGKRGCLEAIAGRLAIATAAAAAAYRGEAPVLLEKAGTDILSIKSGVLAASIQGGDKAVEKIVRHAARWLGIGVANVINLLAPDLVVLGGGLVEAMPDLYRDEVEKAATGRVMPGYEKTFKVVVAKLGDDATATGAASWCKALVHASKKQEKSTSDER